MYYVVYIFEMAGMVSLSYDMKRYPLLTIVRVAMQP